MDEQRRDQHGGQRESADASPSPPDDAVWERSRVPLGHGVLIDRHGARLPGTWAERNPWRKTADTIVLTASSRSRTARLTAPPPRLEGADDLAPSQSFHCPHVLDPVQPETDAEDCQNDDHCHVTHVGNHGARPLGAVGILSALGATFWGRWSSRWSAQWFTPRRLSRFSLGSAWLYGWRSSPGATRTEP
jgi:hypothetical protein